MRDLPTANCPHPIRYYHGGLDGTSWGFACALLAAGAAGFAAFASIAANRLGPHPVPFGSGLITALLLISLIRAVRRWIDLSNIRLILRREGPAVSAHLTVHSRHPASDTIDIQIVCRSAPHSDLENAGSTIQWEEAARAQPTHAHDIDVEATFAVPERIAGLRSTATIVIEWRAIVTCSSIGLREVFDVDEYFFADAG